MKISVETKVNAPINDVWSAWTTPDDITHWNFASDDWCCPRAEIELKPGGQFSYRMEAKDGSMGFDFTGEFTTVEHGKRLEFKLGDQRCVEVTFREAEDGILVNETFDAEDKNSAALQKQGWQAILNNFKKYLESK